MPIPLACACLRSPHLTAGSVQRGVPRSRATPGMCRCHHHSPRDVTTARAHVPGIPLPDGRFLRSAAGRRASVQKHRVDSVPPIPGTPRGVRSILLRRRIARHPYLLPLSGFTSCGGPRSLLTGNHRNSNGQSLA
jgi:hypothetical protein